MEKRINLSLVLMLLMGIGMAHAQKDTSAVKAEGPAVRFVSVQFGGGGATKGTFINIGGSMVFRNYVGFAVDANMHLSNPEYVPSDYSGLPPQNTLSSVSMRFVKDIPSRKPNARFRWGLELGPSINNYTSVTIRPNPDWGSGWFNLSGKYTMTRTRRKGLGLGLSFRAKVISGLMDGVGLSLAAVANINEYISYGGVELSMLMGKITEKQKRKN